ncbi:hypothetical protein BC829DRAFT_487815 [Chytridium lagenaria]|nr:hypothetical protein BC829DRAFT_487815 [Chytridium lagenaria]
MSTNAANSIASTSVSPALISSIFFGILVFLGVGLAVDIFIRRRRRRNFKNSAKPPTLEIDVSSGFSNHPSTVPSKVSETEAYVTPPIMPLTNLRSEPIPPPDDTREVRPIIGTGQRSAKNSHRGLARMLKIAHQINGYHLLLLSSGRLNEIGITLPTMRANLLFAVDQLRVPISPGVGVSAARSMSFANDAPPQYF